MLEKGEKVGKFNATSLSYFKNVYLPTELSFAATRGPVIAEGARVAATILNIRLSLLT